MKVTLELNSRMPWFKSKTILLISSVQSNYLSMRNRCRISG